MCMYVCVYVCTNCVYVCVWLCVCVCVCVCVCEWPECDGDELNMWEEFNTEHTLFICVRDLDKCLLRIAVYDSMHLRTNTLTQTHRHTHTHSGSLFGRIEKVSERLMNNIVFRLQLLVASPSLLSLFSPLSFSLWLGGENENKLCCF